MSRSSPSPQRGRGPGLTSLLALSGDPEHRGQQRDASDAASHLAVAAAWWLWRESGGQARRLSAERKSAAFLPGVGRSDSPLPTPAARRPSQPRPRRRKTPPPGRPRAPPAGTCWDRGSQAKLLLSAGPALCAERPQLRAGWGVGGVGLPLPQGLSWGWAEKAVCGRRRNC